MKSEYLKDVSIDNCYFNKCGVREIVNVLSNKVSLSSIKIVDTNVEEESIKPLASTIRNNVNLKILQLDSCNLQAGIEKIINAIEGITTLKSLSITNNEYISPTISDRLATALQSNNSLNQLDLANNNLKTSAIIILQCVSMIISHLRLLNLEGNHIPREAGEALEFLIINNPGIEILILNNNNLCDGAVKIARALKSVTSLKTLDLGNNDLPESIMNEFSQIFISNKCLERLSLCNNNLKSSIVCILKSLATIVKLEYLDIRGNQVTGEASELVASVIQNNKGVLNVLLLGNNNIEKGTMQIVKALQQITSLKVLDLANNNIPKEVCNDLAVAINSNNHLEKLILQGNKLHSSAIVILQSLSKISSIEVLDLQGCQLSESTGAFISPVVLNNKSLKCLNLRNNNIANGLVHIAKALQQIKSLNMLDLGNNDIPMEVCKELVPAIYSNTHLQKLWLHENKLHASSITILQSLSLISDLRVLNMNNDQIGEKGGEILASAIIRNSGLKCLHLASNNLQRSVTKILQALQSISTLVSVDLSNNNFPEGISSKVAVAIQSNHSLKELWLHSNNLKSSINVILDALSKLSTLELIDMHSSHLTSLAAKGLESVIKNNTGLKRLYINDNNIGKGLIIILKALKSISSLYELNIKNNNFMNNVIGDLGIANKMRVFIESLCQCSDFSDSSELLLLKKLCIASKLQTSVTIVEEAEIALASTLQNNPGLQVLHVDNGCLSQPPKHFIKSLKYANSIKVLDLSNFNLSEELVSELTSSIKSHTSLEKIYLYNGNLKSSVIILSEVLATISTLKLLDLQSNGLTEEVGNSLASVIINNKALEVLFLDNNNISEGAVNIAKALQNINSLKMLGLNNNNLPKEISHEIASVIKSNRHLELLTLSSNNLQSSAIEILQCLTTINTLKVLNMNNNLIGEKASEALASVVLNNTGLQELYISNNNLGDGILEVARALQHIKLLLSVNLGNNNVPKEASGKLAHAVKSNKCLERLWLYDNNLGSSAFIILQALCTISSLKVLNINNNQIGKAGGEVLVSVIKNNTGLRELNISNSNIQNSVMKISEALQGNTTIDTLNLSNNNLRQCDKLAISDNSLTELQLHNNLQSSLITILKALCFTTKLKIFDLYGNIITKEAGNLLAYVLSRNTNLQGLSLNLLTAPLKVTEALQNLSALQSLTFDTCNVSEDAESKIASVITNNKSLTWLSLENINLSHNVILSIMTISNLTSLWLGDSSLSEEICDDLSLAISRNTSMEGLVLLDNMLQTGLIKITEACNKLSNIQVLHLAHNCIIPSKVVELTSIITQNTSLLTVLLGGITLNAAECFHYNINEVLHKTDSSYNKTSCVMPSNHCTLLEVMYSELQLRNIIDKDKKCLTNNPIYLNAKNFNFVHKIQCYFGHNDIIQLKTHQVKQKLVQVDAKKIISSLSILQKVKVIDLENNNIDEDASFELATALHSNNVLEQLWLRGNKLNTAGALNILNSLEYLTTLQVLDMSYNNIGSQSADGIAAVIDNNPLINQLWLDGNDLHSTGTITICNALKKIITLSILSLCNNGISDDAADELSAVITQNILLEDLLLSNNHLHSTGIKVIAKSLSKLLKLRKLDLFNNNIGKGGASSLAIVIRNSPTLQDLFLSGNNLETSGALEICNALSHINSLHVLTLSNNNISDEVTSQLIKVLNNNHLYALLIGGNGLECGGLKIAQVIENDNIAMQLLDFSNNNISEQDKEKIKVVFSKRANFKLYV